MQSGSYEIDPVTAAGRQAIAGVLVDEEGAWLGEIVERDGQRIVQPYSEDGGRRIAAPEHWTCLIVKRLG